ncbi:ABC transporter permease [Fervidicoccus fontis]|uniref:Iron ABC transporter permease n=1 Tax=Fervidicoccus fontis TaxID=683846 RepID=A0A7C2VP37_9CREN|nr:iron ABC transporter permease [Fervidicoccus fontis]PMB76290.1 MAG: iron ABC transporter permease [Fervidicoccus fontis]HEW64361.1 iron ABC transporter permease [Fervidicoccus fontis]
MNIDFKGFRSLKLELDRLLISQIFFSYSYLILFMILPIVSIFASVRNFNFSLFLQPQYINLHPIGTAISVNKFGSTTFIKISGVSYGIILNSIIIAIFVTVISIFIGLLVAFVLARYSFPLKTLLRILAIVPLLMTPFINTYVMKKFIGPSFGVNTLSWILSHILNQDVRLSFSDIAGIIIAQAITFYPIVYLNVYSSMMNIDPSLEEQAENLGAKGFKLFRSVTFPLSFPGLAAGAVLVFIFSIEDVGAPLIFGFRDVLSYQIYSYFQGMSVGIGNPVAGALALTMLLISLVLFISIRRQVSLRQYAMVSKGGRAAPRERKLRLKGKILVYLFVFPLVLVTISPQIGVAMLAFSKQWSQSPLPQGFTLNYFFQLFSIPGVYRGIINSLVYSTAAVAIIILLGLSISYVVARVKLPGISLLDYLSTIALAIPGLVVAFGYFFFFHDVFPNTLLDPIYNPAIPLILAYSVRRLPFTSRSIYAGLQQTHLSLEEASINLGASRARTLASIVIPLIILNITSGAMITFVYCMGETSVSITIGGLGGDVSSPNHKGPITMVMLDLIVSGRIDGTNLAAALGVLLMLLQIIVIIIITLVFKQSYAFIGV